VDPVVPPSEEVELDVTGVAAGGDGLARPVDGPVVFVTGALPGERVRARVLERKRDYARAVVAEVLTPSPDRARPPCAGVADGCGGCDWQHVVPDAQRRLKAAVVADALRRQAGLDVPVGLGPDLPGTGYRTTLRGLSRGGRFGFRRRHEHEVVPVDPCVVAHPLLAELVAEGRFPDGEVVLRAGARTGDRLVVVAGDGTQASLPAGVRVVGAAALAAGERAWYHEEAAGRRWRISARSFFQSRPDGADALVELVGDAVADALGDGLVDLYGGVGLFAGALAHDVPATLVEHSPSSAADARVNLGGGRAKVVRMDVARWRPRRAGAVVADPPRAGLGKVGVRTVAGTGARRIALVSCDPAALGRDARLLREAGYELRRATLVDLFPMTSHVEVVSRFDLAEEAPPRSRPAG
jgi:23S rRNA (uracil1939-C5)-methyltransferase